jgi:DNA-binding MarR family transcriptional regulator
MNSTEQLLTLNNTLQKYKIGLTLFIFVSCVETDQDLKLTEIGDKLNLSPAAMTMIRDKAVEAKFIIETKTIDRRTKCYEITDLGKELLASARQ